MANADTDAKVCIGTSVASPCVIRITRRGKGDVCSFGTTEMEIEGWMAACHETIKVLKEV